MESRIVFSVINMANGFWSVPLHPERRPWLAYQFEGEQFQWTRLPQGLHSSPNLYHQALRQHLAGAESPVRESTLVQYIDDVMLASPNMEVHTTELLALLTQG